MCFGVDFGRCISPNHMLQLLDFLSHFSINKKLCISQNSSSYKGSYFKYRGEASQMFWICFGGAVRQGAA